MEKVFGFLFDFDEGRDTDKENWEFEFEFEYSGIKDDVFIGCLKKANGVAK